jgi:phage-related minor tail protein
MKFGGAVMGIMAVRAAIDNLVAAGHEWVDLAEIQEKAETRLQAVLMSTGHAAGFNLDQLKAMASGMQNVTTVGDEVILSGMSILATFKNVRQEAFERATMAALDMSEVMGQDLKSSTIQLGKALNDPVQGITALTRVGVSFTDEQKKMIQALVESGDIMAAQNIILQELESEFGGAAKAASETFGGAVTQADNSLGDLKEELGFVITKNQFFIELAHMATKTFADRGGKIQDNRQYLMELAKDGVLWVVDALTNAIATVGAFQVGWLNLKGVFWTVVNVLAEGMQYVLDGLHLLLSPLELIYDGMVKLGLLDFNPLTEAMNSLQGGLQSVAKYSEEAAIQAAADALETEQGYQKVIDTLVDMRGKIASIPVTQVKADQAIVKSNARANKAIQQNNKDTEEKTLKQIEAEKKAREKAEKEKQKIVSDFNKKYKRLVLGQYEFEREQIRLQAEAYIKAGADEVKVRKWMQAEIEKVNKQETEDKRRSLEEQTKATKEAYREQTLASDDFFAGMKLGWEDLTSKQRTWAQTGYDIVQDFAHSASRVMSDVLFDAITGDMKDLEEYWDAFWKSMLRSMTDYISQMAVQWATSQLVEYGGSFLSDLITFHSGLVKLEDDELLAVLQQGEMVIPAKQAEAIRSAVSEGGYSKDGFFNAVVDAINLGTRNGYFAGFSATTPADVAGIMAGKAISQSIAGAFTGFDNYSAIMNQVQALQAAGFNIDMTKAITDLKMLEYTHKAAMQTAARILQPTLLDFLR